MNYTSLLDKYFESFFNYLPTLIATIVFFVVGLIIIKILTNYLRRFMTRREMDEALKNFLLNSINLALKIILILMTIGHLGIKTTSLLALLGSAGLAIGLALQGSLSNLAGGVIIIVLKPFKIGHWIEVNNFSGTVKEVSLFYTRLINGNGLLVNIPNGNLANQTIVNYTVEGKRTDRIKINIATYSDIELAKKILIDLILPQEGIIKNSVKVRVSSVTSDYTELTLEFTAKVSKFWDIHYYSLEQIEKVLKEAEIQFPTTKYDINMSNTK